MRSAGARVALGGPGRVVDGVVVPDLVLQTAHLLLQGAGTAVAEEPEGGSGRGRTAHRSCRTNSTTCPSWQCLMQFTQMAFRSVVLHVMHLRGGREWVEHLLVEVVHGEGGAGADLEQTVPPLHRPLHRVLVVLDPVVPHDRVHVGGQAQPCKVGRQPAVPGPPPNLLFCRMLPSSVAVAPLVISIPAARPSRIRLRFSVGLDSVEMSTPACAFR